MVIRLGYVSISKTLDNVTSSSTITVSSFNKERDYNKLSNIIISNLEALIKILEYNVKNNIHFYRISSNLIPLATHPNISFDYIDKYKSYYESISNIINKDNIRVDMHPGQYCVINSTKKEVVKSSIEILKYHYNLLNAMNIENKILILHIGSSVLGKTNSITRFINNFKKLPTCIQKSIAIENDDKVFNIKDCLYLSKELNIPVVLDYHHFLCNNSGEDIKEYLNLIFDTWKSLRPKFHFSSPKSKKEYRSHHEYIDVNSFISFIDILKEFDRDIDIMIEAKGKDESLFRLIRQLKYQTNYKFIDETSFEV